MFYQEESKASPASSFRILQPSHPKLRIGIPIVCGWIFAAAAALGHHIFLSSLDGDYVEDSSQFLVKSVNNALAHVVVILLGIALTYSLTQMVREHLKLSIRSANSIAAVAGSQ